MLSRRVEYCRRDLTRSLWRRIIIGRRVVTRGCCGRSLRLHHFVARDVAAARDGVDFIRAVRGMRPPDADFRPERDDARRSRPAHRRRSQSASDAAEVEAQSPSRATATRAPRPISPISSCRRRRRPTRRYQRAGSGSPIASATPRSRRRRSIPTATAGRIRRARSRRSDCSAATARLCVAGDAPPAAQPSGRCTRLTPWRLPPTDHRADSAAAASPDVSFAMARAPAACRCRGRAQPPRPRRRRREPEAPAGYDRMVRSLATRIRLERRSLQRRAAFHAHRRDNRRHAARERFPRRGRRRGSPR